MHFPIPDFVPFPSAGTLHTISTVALAAGVCLTGGAALYLFCNRGKRNARRLRWIWGLLGVGVLLTLNHGIQLLF